MNFGFEMNFDNLLDMSDKTAEFNQADIQKNKIVSLFSYLGILILVPILAAPDSEYARFHANQGITLLIYSVVSGIVFGILSAIFAIVGLWFIPFILALIVELAIAVLAIWGIVNAATGKAQVLPFLGTIKIFK